MTFVVVQDGPKVGTQYTIYCVPTFGPLCILKFFLKEEVTFL